MAPITDQRDAPFVRVFGVGIDIGAYESQSLALVVDNTAFDKNPRLETVVGFLFIRAASATT